MGRCLPSRMKGLTKLSAFCLRNKGSLDWRYAPIFKIQMHPESYRDAKNFEYINSPKPNYALR